MAPAVPPAVAAENSYFRKIERFVASPPQQYGYIGEIPFKDK
jgi:hypothetical protein